ncbi:hypothetical protein B0H11DRAFT_2187093 [Mycena galericulata]|nr:hypothetical protein B0H11DRAFT_2187093 [Mycena galericulata]
MSTGGRKVIRKMIYDDEAEEDNALERDHDSDAEQDGSEGGQDGHVNEDEDMEEENLLSDWEQTARSSSDVELSGSEGASPTKAPKPKSPKKKSRSDKAARIQTGPAKSLKGSKSVQKTLNVRTAKRTTDTSQGDLNVSADEYNLLRGLLVEGPDKMLALAFCLVVGATLDDLLRFPDFDVDVIDFDFGGGGDRDRVNILAFTFRQIWVPHW